MEMQQFITVWSGSGASERANKDSYLKDLADVLGVPQPSPRTGDRERDTYVFEADADIAHEGGTVSIGKMDLCRRSPISAAERRQPREVIAVGDRLAPCVC